MSLGLLLLLTVVLSYLGLLFVFWQRTERGPIRSRLIGGLHGVAFGLLFLFRLDEAPEPAAALAGVLMALALIAAGLGMWLALNRPALQNSETEFWCNAAITASFIVFLFLRGVNTWFQVGSFILVTLLFFGLQLAMGKSLFEEKQPEDVQRMTIRLMAWANGEKRNADGTYQNPAIQGEIDALDAQERARLEANAPDDRTP